MTAQHVIQVILSSILILSAAESLYSRACSSGDPVPACKNYCELCQTGCLPPGKTITTKTFVDVCNEEQKLQFEKERNKVTKICQDYLDGLTDDSSTDTDDNKNTNNNIDVTDDKSKHEDSLGTATQIIDDVYTKIKTTNPILTAIIGLQFIFIVALISRLRSKRDQKPGPTEDQQVSGAATLPKNGAEPNKEGKIHSEEDKIQPQNHDNEPQNNKNSEPLLQGGTEDK